MPLSKTSMSETCSFVKLKSIKYHFNVVEGKSGIRATKAVDFVF